MIGLLPAVSVLRCLNSIPQNNFASWKFANDQGNHTISQPVLSILATEVRSREYETGKLTLS